jgi:hypothetical protein
MYRMLDMEIFKEKDKELQHEAYTISGNISRRHLSKIK